VGQKERESAQSQWSLRQQQWKQREDKTIGQSSCNTHTYPLYTLTVMLQTK